MAKHAKTTEGRGSSVPEGVFIVIPAYKEEQSIGTVVRDLHAHAYANVIVVDDGSPDNTSAVAEKAGAIVVRHVINRGQGAALKTGIDYALDQGAEYIVTFDADGQHRPEDIPALLKHVVAGEADVALGSRFIPSSSSSSSPSSSPSSSYSSSFSHSSSASNVPFIRRLFLKGGTVLVWAMYGIRLTDVHNGLRVLSRSAAETIELRADKMEHASEILEQVAKHRLRYVEIPVTIRYTEYSIKNTKQGSLPALRIAFRMFLNKFLR